MNETVYGTVYGDVYCSYILYMNKNLIRTVYDRFTVDMNTEPNMENIYERYTVNILTNGVRCRIRYRISFVQKKHISVLG